MSALFNRKYELTIANTPPKPKEVLVASYSELSPLREGSIITNDGKVIGVDTDSRTEVDLDTVVINDLQITSNIKSNDSGSGKTTTTISIYNLSPRTLQAVEKPNSNVILKAGYAEDRELRVIFTGQVESSETMKDGRDVVTKLTCSDGQTATNSVRVSKSFTREQTYNDVIEYLVDQYEKSGISRGDIITNWSEFPINYTNLPAVKNKPYYYKLTMGYSVTGFLHQALDSVCKEIGYVNYITNGKLFVYPDKYTATVEQYEFTSKQMKSIRPIKSTSGGTSINEGIDGIKITTFLDGRLDIDKRVKVTDGSYAGEYKITEKEHILNYEAGEWTTVVSCNRAKA